MEYPRSIVWFIRAEEDDKPPSEGSAVAVRLQRKGSLGDAGMLYLITCSHVVRKGKGNETEFGSCYKRIRAWAPGWSFSEVDPKSGVAVSPVQDVIPTESNSSEFWRRPIKLDGHADWVLLQFEDRSVAEPADLPSLTEWNTHTSNSRRLCSIIGYPGGSARIMPPNRMVEPTLGFSKVPITKHEAGLVTFEGVQTRSGMSGGGVFDVATNGLVGLHRSRDDLALDLFAVAAQQIHEVVAKRFDFFPSPNRLPSEETVRFDVNIFANEELVALATMLLKKPIAECGTGSRIEVSIGKNGKVMLALSEFAADSMQRLALKGTLDLLQTQQASITSLQEKDALGLFPGAAFGIQIGRLQLARNESLDEIRRRVELMVGGSVFVDRV